MLWTVRQRIYSFFCYKSICNDLIRFIDYIFALFSVEVTLERFQEFAKEFVKKVKFEWLIYGNVTAAVSIHYVVIFKKNVYTCLKSFI